MKWSSIRVRLTLWNVGVFALILAGLGATLCYSVRADSSAAIDRGLREGVEWNQDFFQHRTGPFRPREHRPDDRSRSGSADVPREDRRAETPPGGRAGDGSTGRARAPEAGSEPARNSPRPGERERRLPFRRAALLDLNGKPLLRRFSAEAPWDPATFQRSTQGATVFSNVFIDGEEFRVYSAPLQRDGKTLGVVQVTHSLIDQKRLNEGLVRRLLTLIPLGLLIAGIGGIFLTDRALRPVRKITQAAAQLGAEDLSKRLDVPGKDELGELAMTFNGMIGRLEEAFGRLGTAYQELETAYEQQRRFSGDASHELRTPLTRIKASTSLALARQRTPEEYRRALEVADHAADTMNRIVQDLLLLARSDADRLVLDRRPVPIQEILRRAVGTMPERECVAITLQLPEEPLEVYGDPDQLVRVFVNLLDNAIRHTPVNGRITLSTRSEGDLVSVRTEDTGEGIPPEHLPHVCDRFYRVDAARSRAGHAAGGGTGLGLAISQSIIEAHAGELRIESEVGRGTVVTVSLPGAVGARVEESVAALVSGE